MFYAYKMKIKLKMKPTLRIKNTPKFKDNLEKSS